MKTCLNVVCLVMLAVLLAAGAALACAVVTACSPAVTRT